MAHVVSGQLGSSGVAREHYTTLYYTTSLLNRLRKSKSWERLLNRIVVSLCAVHSPRRLRLVEHASHRQLQGCAPPRRASSCSRSRLIRTRRRCCLDRASYLRDARRMTCVSIPSAIASSKPLGDQKLDHFDHDNQSSERQLSTQCLILMVHGSGVGEGAQACGS